MSEPEIVVPLQVYVDRRFEEQEKLRQEALRNGEAYIAQFLELRREFNVLRTNMVSRDTIEMLMADTRRRMEDMATTIAATEDRVSAIQTTTAASKRTFGLIATVISFVLTILGAAFVGINWIRGLP